MTTKRSDHRVSLTEWPQRKFAAVPPNHLAVDLALEVRRAALGRGRGEVMPFDIAPVCKFGGFRIQHRKLIHSREDHEAMLVPTAAGVFDIFVDPSVAHLNDAASKHLVATEIYRLRFRVAHEIGHSFFYDRARRPPVRLLAASKEEEQFCDCFASALLLPPTVIRNLRPSAETILKLRRDYGASAEVVARAIVNLHPEISVLGLMRRMNPHDGVEGLRIIWSAGATYIPWGKRFLCKAVEQAVTGTRGQATEELNLGGLRGKFFVDAARPALGTQIVVVIIASPRS